MEERARMPGIAGYIVAAIILIAGIGVGALLMVRGVKGVADMLSGPFAMPGAHELVVKETGTYIIFHETSDGTAPGRLSGMDVSLTSKTTGQSVPLDPAVGANVTYSINQRQGEGVYSFTADEAGTYVLTGTYPPGQPGPQVDLTVGGGGAEMAKGIGGMVGGCCTLPVAFVAAFVVWLVTLLRRGKAKRRQQQPPQDTAAPPPPPPQAP